LGEDRQKLTSCGCKKQEIGYVRHQERNTSGAYQGAKYFFYNGKLLDEIRKEKEVL